MMKKRITWFVAALIIATMSYLLWPVEKSADWNIVTDQQALRYKQKYLQSIRQHGNNTAQPNVLLIVADDLGKHDISLYGHSPLATPHIDHLGQSGLVFAEAYATAAICAPSRAGLLTGRYQNRFGFESQPMQRYIRNELEFLVFSHLIETDEMEPVRYPSYPTADNFSKQGLPPSEITLGEIFQASGYETALIGKWHLGYGEDNHPLDFGFDHQFGFLEAFSLYAPEDDPGVVNHHHDLFWEKHIWSQQRSGPSAIQRDGNVIEESRYLTDAIVEEALTFIASAQKKGKPFFAYLPFSAPHTPFQARRADYDSLADVGDQNHRVYLAMIRRLDWAVGELTRYLEQVGLADNTLIIFASDNGGATYTKATDNGPLRDGKFTQFEGGLAIPMMMYWPGKIAPDRVLAPVMLTDVLPTLNQLLGLPLPADRIIDGQDLLQSQRESALAHRALFWRCDFNRAVRFERWKLLHNKKTNSIHLFDLRRDLGERRNIAREHPEIVKQLMMMLDDWETELEPAKWPRVMDYFTDEEGEGLWFAI
jgi:arylsulfatase A-like enzyme